MKKRDTNVADQRVGARDKVRGATRYAADDVRPGLLHGAIVPSRITCGTIRRIDSSAALRIAGVQLVLTHENVGPFESGGFLMGGGFGFQSFQPLRSAQIAYRGQPLALVIATSIEAAREAALAVVVEYDATAFSSTIDAPGAQTIAQASLPNPMFADKNAGDALAALRKAPVTVDLTYQLPNQHQNPMELIATVAEWQDGELTVWEPTQNAEGIRHGLAKQLSMDASDIRVVSPHVGGGFGQKNSLQSHTVLVAIAAKKLGLPVKLVLTRSQLFHTTSFRPASRHRVQLGADSHGKLTAAIHETDQQTSRHDLFPSMGTDMTARLYGIANFKGIERLVRTDVQTPGYMRAPLEHPAAFAFESAVDEMAYRLGMDPVALRLANDTTTDPITGKPFSSRHVARCLQQGAQEFGWSRRTMAPGSMRDAKGNLVGWGVAIGVPQRPEQLAQHRLLGFTEPASLNLWPLLQCGAEGWPVTPTIAASSVETLRHLALSGAGIVCLADYLTRADVASGRLVPLLTAHLLPWTQPIWAVFYRQGALAPRVTALLDFLAARLADGNVVRVEPSCPSPALRNAARPCLAAQS